MRLFNRIRNRLLHEKQFSAYLKYAIGEIFLVVVGILIALSINNWNQNRILHNQTCELLSSMIADIEADIQFSEKYDGFYSEQIITAQNILMDSIDPHMKADSIYVSLLLWTISLQENTQSYEKIKNTGITTLLHSRSLDSAITEYYVTQLHHVKGLMQWDVDQTEELNKFWNSSLQMELADPFSLEVTVPYSQPESVRRAEIVRVLHTLDGRKALRSSISNKKAIINMLRGRRMHALRLKELLENQLQEE